jgi:hypothetical protein
MLEFNSQIAVEGDLLLARIGSSLRKLFAAGTVMQSNMAVPLYFSYVFSPFSFNIVNLAVIWFLCKAETSKVANEEKLRLSNKIGGCLNNRLYNS